MELLDGVLPPATLARTVRLIEAAVAHAIPPGLDADEVADMARFLDMDLSILGAPEATFDRYEASVRVEYAHVPEQTFRTGRAAILERFLARAPLFFSPRGARGSRTRRRTISGARSLRFEEMLHPAKKREAESHNTTSKVALESPQTRRSLISEATLLPVGEQGSFSHSLPIEKSMAVAGLAAAAMMDHLSSFMMVCLD